MPEPIPPAWLGQVTLKPFCLSDEDRKKIASILGLPRLPPSMVQTIEYGIALYKTLSDLPAVTVGQNVAAIDEGLNLADKLEPALRRFTDVERTGVGLRTVHELKPSATKCLVAMNEFRAAAQVRKQELRQIKRLGREHGPLGALFAWLRLLFDVTEEVKQDKPENNVERLRAFGRAVLEVADIPCEKYYVHPSRMDPLFKVVVPDGLQTQHFTAELRQEIAAMLRACDK